MRPRPQPDRSLQQIASDLLTKKLEFLGNKQLEPLEGQVLTRDNTARDFLVDYLDNEEITHILTDKMLDAKEAVADDPNNAELQKAFEAVKRQQSLLTRLATGSLVGGSEKVEAETLKVELRNQRVIPKLIPLLEKLAKGERLSIKYGETKEIMKPMRVIKKISDGLKIMLEMQQTPEVKRASQDIALHGGAVEPGESIKEAITRKAGGEEETPNNEEERTHIQAQSNRRDKLAVAILNSVLKDLNDISRWMLMGKGASFTGGPPSSDDLQR